VLFGVEVLILIDVLAEIMRPFLKSFLEMDRNPLSKTAIYTSNRSVFMGGIDHVQAAGSQEIESEVVPSKNN